MRTFSPYGRHALRLPALLGLALVACVESTVPDVVAPVAASMRHDGSPGDPNAANGDLKAFIGAWLDGERVELRYTRSYYCAQPPTSVAPTGCEIGALPEDFPRGGPMPVIYAIAPVGFAPDPSTLHCPAAPLCPDHPPMIDVTRLGIPGVSIVARAPHSHIITSRQAGWHRTVNVRVLTQWAWDQIVATPTLETVRELQRTSPSVISGDNPTNIFFFFQVHSGLPGN
jgi:hypothetical protein